MTFQEWQATREGPRILPSDEAGTYDGAQGYLYDGGFIVIDGDRFMVPMPQSEETFATLAEAEAYLWAEWCDGEING